MDAAGASPPFRGPCADDPLGEALIDALALVALAGFAAELAPCRFLCNETFEIREEGAVAWVLRNALEAQCRASARRAAPREPARVQLNSAVRTLFSDAGNSSTQLMRASERGELTDVLALLRFGAAPDAATRAANALAPLTALLLAISSGRTAVVRALLAAGASPRLGGGEPGHKIAPIIVASVAGHADIIRLLIKAGASPDEDWPTGRRRPFCSPLHAASTADALAALLEARPRLDDLDCDGLSALHRFLANAQGGSRAALLISAGARVDLRDKSGRTALHLAVYWQPELVAAIIAADSGVAGARDGEGATPLHVAKYASSVPLLRAAGIDANARDENGYTPLHLACGGGLGRDTTPLLRSNHYSSVVAGAEKTALVAALLAHGADANAQSPSGMTALMWSSACGAINEVRLLLGAAPSSADLNARAIDGRTALLVAVAARSASVAGTGVVAALLRAGAGAEASERDEALRLACLHGHTEAVFELLEYGASANSRDAFGRSPLWLAACANHLNAVQRLLARGADPGSRDAFGRSPLDAAVRAAASHRDAQHDGDFVSVIGSLRAAGAEPDTALVDGFLHAALIQALTEPLPAAGAPPAQPLAPRPLRRSAWLQPQEHAYAAALRRAFAAGALAAPLPGGASTLLEMGTALLARPQSGHGRHFLVEWFSPVPPIPVAYVAQPSATPETREALARLVEAHAALVAVLPHAELPPPPVGLP